MQRARTFWFTAVLSLGLLAAAAAAQVQPPSEPSHFRPSSTAPRPLSPGAAPNATAVPPAAPPADVVPAEGPGLLTLPPPPPPPKPRSRQCAVPSSYSGQLGGERGAPGTRRGGLGCQQQQAALGQLAAELLGPLGGRRLQPQRREPRADLLLDVRRPLEVEPDAGRASARRGDGGACTCRGRRPPRPGRGARRAGPAGSRRRCPGR